MSMDQLMALVPIEAATAKKKRKTRWERVDLHMDTSPFGHVDVPCGLTPGQVDQFLREQRYQELSKKLADGELEFGDEDIRPPSPPPMYDKMGSRINTREIRTKTAMTDEHQRLTEYMIATVTSFIPPNDFKPSKKQRRIEIPLEKYPEYNFMGLIIGPRGCNHKRLEAESGAQISIRGKGTQKDGKRDHQTEEESQMPMHVHIVADTEEILEKAVNLVEPLLDPFHPMHEEFKKRGLTQLALVNGVNFSALDQQRCAVCGATGHLASECQDNKELQNFKKADVRCAICGDKGHVTMDCRLAKQRAGTPTPAPPPPSASPTTDSTKSPYQLYMEKIKMDQEYQKMMNELTGGTSSKLEGLDGDSNQASTSPGVKGVSATSTPPPGVSPGAPSMSTSSFNSSPSPPAPPPPPNCAMQRPVTPLGGSVYNRPGPCQMARSISIASSRPPPPPCPGQWPQHAYTTPGGTPGVQPPYIPCQPPFYPPTGMPAATAYPPLFNSGTLGMAMPTAGFPDQQLQAQMAGGYQPMPMGMYPPGLVSLPMPSTVATPMVANTGVKSEGAVEMFMTPDKSSASLPGDDNEMDTSN